MSDILAVATCSMVIGALAEEGIHESDGDTNCFAGHLGVSVRGWFIALHMTRHPEAREIFKNHLNISRRFFIVSVKVD